ncbi:unnamed protein product [Onchocerca flexuosa]|uniref:Zf-GRF domain-containing protein n=1 Tax=Onchocerca flexuosa TaxID=387005 RepID=A0A183HTB4_9BILA|nr:unnamed protein product [Onchocerca flexuosa]
MQSTKTFEFHLALSILHTNIGTRRRTRTANVGDGRAKDRVGAGDKRQCSCGQVAKRLIVKKEGPNHGRAFWTCPKGRDNPEKCKYFEWEGSRNNDEPS